MSGCRLVNDITGGVDVEGGEAVHFTLDVRLPAVLLWHAFGNLGMDQAPVLTASSPFFAKAIPHRKVGAILPEVI